ncbi:E3 ubiquitin-protein ligase HOS1 [Auxenochlorella protothecoides]|uniref:E3 ubiquitin-protein ligase HOS1 n=1 Tax=Auxenochlorella protothecoides TaxID=3075 RepID=A0A087SBK1_AUXPR|nr:E3 ubiquitin-protein ligase HOS1 [Auxenochlorella protothecoides]KFM23105.1 E3 ubiquitin-protein ligase HOS1 [Auxenochlorella protothecoides]
MAQAALDALVDTSPREYFTRVGHQTRLQALHAQCAEAGLFTASATADDVSRLFALFTLSLENGFGTLVVDYLAEVCFDTQLTSSDPTQAFLMDGQCVRRWLQRTLSVIRSRVVTALGQGLGAPTSAGVLARATAELSSLHLVAHALSPPTSLGKGAAAADSDETEVARALQAARAGAWVVTQGLERLIQSLFLAGASGSAALHAKLMLLAFHLADGGWCGRRELLDQLWLTWHVQRDVGSAWLLQHFLDASLVPEHPSGVSALEEAVACAGDVSGTQLPLKALRVLLERGRPEAALLLARQRCLPAQTRDLEEASAALSICLASGLLAEAVLRMKQHLREVEEAQRAQHADALLGQLFEWGAAAQQLHALIRLPFTVVEEEAALAWLSAQAGSHPPAAAMWALYYLERGRTPEALFAYAHAFPPGPPTSEPQAQLVALMERAARDLPTVYASLVVRVDPGARGPSLRPLSGGDDEQGAGERTDVALGFALPTPALPGAGRRLLATGPRLRDCPLVCLPERVARGGEGEEGAGEDRLPVWPDLTQLSAKLVGAGKEGGGRATMRIPVS